jgi:hypothetical protein
MFDRWSVPASETKFAIVACRRLRFIVDQGTHVEVISGIVAKATQFLSSLQVATVLSFACLPILFAIFSKQALPLLLVILLSAVAVCAWAAPAFAATVVAFAAYAGAILIALSAIATRRAANRTNNLLMKEIDTVKKTLAELAAAEQRRIMSEFRTADSIRSEAKDPE